MFQTVSYLHSWTIPQKHYLLFLENIELASILTNITLQKCVISQIHSDDIIII